MRPKPRPDRLGARLLGWLAAFLAACLSCGAALSQPLGVPPVPAKRLQSVPPRPENARFAWQPGHWNWDAAAERYAWQTGRYVVRPPDRQRFVPGRWVQTGGSWAWRRARWR